jgi:lipoprotein-releasing system permease protein
MNRWEPFEWITALRFLKEGRMQTLFIIAAVAIGVAVIVFMSAMLSSLQANFIKRVLTSQPHIQLIPPDEVARPLRPPAPDRIVTSIVQRPTQRIRSIDQWQKIRAQLSEWPDIVTVSPTMTASALAVRGDASRSISLTGIDPEAYFKIVRIPDYIVAGQARVLTEDILVGTELAKDLGVTLGDKINVTAATGSSRILTIAGIFDLGSKGANMRTTFVALRTAQALSNLVGGVTSIDLTVNAIYGAETIAQAVQAATGVEADSWIKTNAQFFTAVNAQQSSNTLIRVFVAYRSRSVSPVCSWSRSSSAPRISASCAPWVRHRVRSCVCFCCRGGCWVSSDRSSGLPPADPLWPSGMPTCAKPTVASCFR